MLRRIISGGQTGADQGALEAAKDLGLETGGYMPKGFRTETGPRSDFKHIFLMQEARDTRYYGRTVKNIQISDGTLIFGSTNSPGTALTINECRNNQKPFYIIIWPSATLKDNASKLRNFISINNIRTLNVAGNRESKNPGIQYACKKLLIEALGETPCPASQS